MGPADNEYRMKPWSKELETGIEVVDEQHKKFIKKANHFVIASRFGQKEEAAAEELEFLQNYLQYHFQTEEAFQVDSHYPGYRDHEAEHLQLKFKVKQMTELLHSSDEEEVFDAFAVFVNNWLIDHIMKSDKKFAKYYIEYQKEH